MSLAKKIIGDHLISGNMHPGEEIAIGIDQTLTQDATGTLVMLELDAMGVASVQTEVSVQYVDHNLLQEDHKNADDHIFLRSACRRFGIRFSGPGNGISHVVHQESFGIPGKTLIGSDSHTPAAGSICMIAVGAGGLEVATAIAGEPFYVNMPEVWGIELTGELPDWVSAKDVVLEMLRRHGVRGGRGKILEYFGKGVVNLSVMDRHVIANMGTELGATTSIFPSDERVRSFFKAQQRLGSWVEIKDDSHQFEHVEKVDLSSLEPMIAMPSSPGNVKKVSEVESVPIYQAYVGSSANPSYRDFAIVAEVVKGQRVFPGVSLDINPTSRQVLANLDRDGHILNLIKAGVRIHQTGCNGCIGMGQAPATEKISLRTVPRNFPGRSGTIEDKVCLVSPETAVASALRGRITDPRTLTMPYPKIADPSSPILDNSSIEVTLPIEKAKFQDLHFGPNISKLPEFESMVNVFSCPVLLVVGDDVSTDEILPAGAKVLPFRSNIPRISEFTFSQYDSQYVNRTKTTDKNQHIIVAGHNYGQGSSREHAALAPRYLGVVAVIAKSFARIHHQNLVNFGILPLIFASPKDYDAIKLHDNLELVDISQSINCGAKMKITMTKCGKEIFVSHQMSSRQKKIITEGGLINWFRNKNRPKNVKCEVLL